MTAPFEVADATNLNAQVVEFIAKPERTHELRAFLCQAVTPLLRDQAGFIRSIVLTRQEEPRRVVMITLWSAEERPVSDSWEETPLVREMLSPLIDASSKTRTYNVDLMEATEAGSQAISLPICRA